MNSAAEIYLALLRGINVGGKNVIRMADLRSCFREGGFPDVVTYIQTGNVIFQSPAAERPTLAARIERMLAATFAYEAKVAILNRKQLRAVVAGAPEGFGARPNVYRNDTIFLIPPLTTTAAIKQVATSPGVDEVWAGEGVLYFARRIDMATRSHLSRLVSMPVYQNMTIRNWKTTTRLLDLMERHAE